MRHRFIARRGIPLRLHRCVINLFRPYTIVFVPDSAPDEPGAAVQVIRLGMLVAAFGALGAVFADDLLRVMGSSPDRRDGHVVRARCTRRQRERIDPSGTTHRVCVSPAPSNVMGALRVRARAYRQSDIRAQQVCRLRSSRRNTRSRPERSSTSRLQEC